MTKNTFTQCLFLDRDGVINVDVNYASKPQDIEFIEGIFPLCQYLQQQGFIIIIVTNQSGIARKFYSESDFQALTQWMHGEFLKAGVQITQTYHCPHHPDITGDCACRKPKAGMLLEAIKAYRIKPEMSIMIGDKYSDMQAAHSAGVKDCIWLTTDSQPEDTLATLIVNSHQTYLQHLKTRDGCID